MLIDGCVPTRDLLEMLIAILKNPRLSILLCETGRVFYYNYFCFVFGLNFLRYNTALLAYM